MKAKQLLGIGLALLTASAWAETEIETAKPVHPPFSGSAEFGATSVSGNTETSTLKAKLDTKHFVGDWENQYRLDWLYAEDSGDRSAERYYAFVQGNYPALAEEYFFISGSGEVDKFSGYEYITTAAMGYGRRLIDESDMMLQAEVGGGYSLKRIDMDQEPDGEDERDLIARLKLEYWWKFSPSAEFNQRIRSDIAIGGGSTITRSETSVTASLVGNLAMKLGFDVRYNSDPVDDTESTDTELAVTLLYKF